MNQCCEKCIAQKYLGKTHYCYCHSLPASTDKEKWQTKFLNAGTAKGLGDLSMMISTVSEIIDAETKVEITGTPYVPPKELEEILAELEKLIKYGDAINTTVERSKLKSFLTQAYSIALQKGREQGVSVEQLYRAKEIGREEGVNKCVEIVKGWHIKKGGYTELTARMLDSLEESK